MFKSTFYISWCKSPFVVAWGIAFCPKRGKMGMVDIAENVYFSVKITVRINLEFAQKNLILETV